MSNNTGKLVGTLLGGLSGWFMDSFTDWDSINKNNLDAAELKSMQQQQQLMSYLPFLAVGLAALYLFKK